MSKPYNYNSLKEDKDLYKAMRMVKEYASEHLPLPNGYQYELLKSISVNFIIRWLTNKGVKKEALDFLLVPNKNGKLPTIEPDGGLLIAVKKDYSGNIYDSIPMLSSEAKHQDSDNGNAIERVFKNYNVIYNLFQKDNIFPFICFGQGLAFSNEFINNKIRLGAWCNINNEVNILFEDENVKHGSFHLREKKWEISEMFDILVEAMKQSYSYFFKNKVVEKATICKTTYV